MKCLDLEKGESLIALAGSVSVVVAQELNTHELAKLAEFLGLLRHNIDIIRIRRLTPKIEAHLDKKT